MPQWSRRTQTGLWTAALAVSVAPPTVGLIATLFGAGSRAGIGGGVFGLSECGAWRQWIHVADLPVYAQLSTMPYLVAVPAFLAWLVTRRRAIGWAAGGILGAAALVQPAMFGYDLARWGRTCAELWLSPFPRWQLTSWAYVLVPALLMLAAAYRPGIRAVRAVSATLVVSLTLGVAGDQEAPRTVLDSPDDCRSVRTLPSGSADTLVPEIKRLSQHQRRLAYICSLRGYPDPVAFDRGAATEEDPLSDAVLLDQGRRACRGEEQMPLRELVRRGARWPTPAQIAYLCPETAAVRLRELERLRAASKAEFQRQQAKATAYCERTVPEGPRPIREATGTIAGGESRAYYIGNGDDGASFDEALDDELVGASGGAVAVLTGTEGDVCLTVRAYRKAPPPALKGWDRVAEVGFDSPEGRSEVGSVWAPAEFPPVTVAGPGPYRLRVHVRGRDDPETYSPEKPKEHHLLVVFPGKSKKPKLFKNKER